MAAYGQHAYGQATDGSSEIALYAGSGAFTLTGYPVHGDPLLALHTAFVMEGFPVTGGPLLATHAAFVLTGNNATLVTLNMATVLYAAPGAFTIAGYAIPDGWLLPSPGAFVMAGNPINFVWGEVVTDVVNMHPIDAEARGYKLVAGVGIHEATLSYAYLAGAAVIEHIFNHDAPQASFYYTMLLADAINMADDINNGHPVSITDALYMHDVLSVIRGLEVIDQLRIAPTNIGNAIYGQTLAQLMQLHDTIAHYVGAEASDFIFANATQTPTYVASPTIVEQLNLHEALANSMIFMVSAGETVNLDDVNIVQLIFNPAMIEDIEMCAAYVSPDGDFTTWVMNTRTNAVTEYQNWQFNSFAQIGHKYLGANAQGLFELNGERDDTTNIIADIKGGLMQFGGSRFSAFSAIYVGMRTEGPMIFKMIDGENNEFVYSVDVQDMKTTRIQTGKGLRARYWAFELISTGPDFDIDSIEFIPVVSTRRI